MNIYRLNQEAWDTAVKSGDNPYTQVVSSQLISDARRGVWQLYLSDQRPVPANWYPPLRDADVLCLASGGGQQAPILAAVGARVTSLDASDAQLDQDRHVAEREQLNMTLVQGDMADLSVFADQSFDLIFNPPSTLFVSDLAPVWRECSRVLRPGGVLMTGFMNPDEFVFDHELLDSIGELQVKFRLPYAEHETLTIAEVEARRQQKAMFHFSHSMESQLGGLTSAGFVMTGFYEDRRPDSDGNPIRFYMPSYYVARFEKR